MLRQFIFVELCLFSSFVNARMISESGDTQLPIRRNLSDLAISVCNDLMALKDEVSKRACPENFLKENLVSSQKREVKVRSRKRNSLEVEATPADTLQLIILIREKDDSADTFIKYCYIHPKAGSCDLSIDSPDVSYVMYSTLVDEVGRTAPWQVDGTVPRAAVHRNYDVRVQFLSSSARDVTGVFTWNQTDDSDVCTNIGNYCSKYGIKTKITPEAGPRVVLKRLPLNDQCFILLTGRFGTTKFPYRTPSTSPDDDINETSDKLNITPEKPENITLEATRDNDDKWTMHVGWAAPNVAPERYNVTIRADDVTSVVVPGNVTSADISGVSGETGNSYIVSVYAINGRHFYHNLAEENFPQYVDSEWTWGEAAGGAWAAVGVLALLLWGLRAHRNTHYHPKPTGQDTKPSDVASEDSDTECCEDQWEIRAERLVLHEVIGEGAFGVVRRGSLAPGGKDVAVKMLKDFPTLEEVRSFRFEMELMKSVGAHPHVVSLVGCCSGKRGLIVAEYCARGDLLSCLRCSWDVMTLKHSAKYSINNNIEGSDYRNDLFKCKLQRSNSRLVVNKMYDLQHCDSEFTSSDLLSFCRQIAMGMEFLAANRLVHRDLAARNVLVTADRMLKIADFGLSRDVYEENEYKQKGNGKMPVKWMALESLTRRIYTSQSDVWSFGVVMWEVITVGGSPYPEVPAARLPKLLSGGYRMPRPVNCSKQLYDLILSCWRVHPRKRPTFAELHQQLDELLNCACADEYLCLELADSAPPTPKAHKYFNMLIRGKIWGREREYERPLKALQGNYNHYSLSPVTINKAPV